MARRKNPLFPVNVWPPVVDAVTLVLASFVLLVLIGVVAQRALVDRLRDRDREVQKLREDKERIERRLRALAPSGSFEVDDDRVIVQGEVLFSSGSDELREGARAQLDRLAGPLAALLAAEPDQAVLVAGHTDDRSINNERFSSNWELSAARAVAVARALVAAGVPPERVIPAGLSAHHPRSAARDDESRRRNRRIEIQLMPLRAAGSPP